MCVYVYTYIYRSQAKALLCRVCNCRAKYFSPLRRSYNQRAEQQPANQAEDGTQVLASGKTVLVKNKCQR